MMKVIKKIFLATLFLLGTLSYAQTGKVGINTTTPVSTVDIKNTNGAQSTFRIANSLNTVNYFRILNTGYLVSGHPNSVPANTPAAIYPLTNSHADFAVVDTDNPNAFLKHYHMNNGAELAAYGAPTDRSGHVFVFSSGSSTYDSGFFLGAVTDKASGVYVGEDGNNGIGVTTKPTETLDIQGGLRIAVQTDITVQPVENGSCPRIGSIVYLGGFWGCTSTGWKRVDN